MRLLSPLRHVVRLTIESVTPLSIASGESHGDIDAPLFRDWNGLPCLSGTSVAGVFRSLYLDYFGEAAAARLFGHEAPRGSDEGEASRLLVSFGYVHKSDDRAVEGWIAATDRSKDTVLSLLVNEAPLLRDHVAIGPLGAAREHLKFDRSSCPVGTRFSLELSLDGAADDAAADRAEIERTAGLILAPYARFGGAGRRGLGRLKVVRARYGCLDRRGKQGRESWIAYRKLAIDEALQNSESIQVAAPPAERSRRRPVVGELALRAKSFWRMGQGSRPWADVGDEKAPDLSPPSEPVIAWEKTGSVTTRSIAPVPGAGVKGAIAHRAEFHLRRLTGIFVEDEKGEGRVEDAPRLMDKVFGAIRGTEGGFAGSVWIDDCIFDALRTTGSNAGSQTAGTRTRTSLDRHTGGVRLQKLFSDEALWQGDIVVTVTVLTRMSANAKNLVALGTQCAKAISWAFEDLCRADLALGAHEAAGDGLFEGTMTWRIGDEEIPDLLTAIEMIDAKAQPFTHSLQGS